ncbi:hypothetical protein F5Y01DRAFT_139596 [Xylaria sp. FL0043]|nr:hypothetical protein F5Y01DRAFT_139596 [Xylaria sp. FL0043]
MLLEHLAYNRAQPSDESHVKTLSRRCSFYAQNALLPTRCIEFRYLDEHGPRMRPVAWSLRDASGQTGKCIALSHRRDDNTEKTRTLVSNYACRSSLCTHTVDSNAVDDPFQLPALFRRWYYGVTDRRALRLDRLALHYPE